MLRILFSAFVWAHIAVSAAHAAFGLEPAKITFLVDQGEKTAFVELVHLSGDPAAIQFTVHERTLDIDGNLVSEERMPKSSDFIVHPSQVILYPKERANVQLQYRGKGKIKEDRAYILFSREVPIELDDESNSNIKVSMLTNYMTNVALETNKPGKLVFVSSKEIGDGKIEVIAENKGQGRVQMDRISIIVNGKAIKSFTGKSNSVMPGTKRRFTFEYPRAVTARDVSFGR